MIFNGQHLPEEFLANRRKRREVFRSESGQKVLFNMLTDAGCFKPIKTVDEMYSRNLAIKWADEIGLFDENRIRAYIKWFMETDIDQLEKEEQAAIDDDSGLQFGNKDVPPYVL